MDGLHQEILHAWKSKNALFYCVLIPLSWLFSLLVWCRRLLYRLNIIKLHKMPVPVIVVGNINLGGSGKTPLVIWLVRQLQAAGFQPGVVSRGYGGSNKSPLAVSADSSPVVTGDEPVLIAQHTQAPVWVGRNRVEVALALLQARPQCNVIISDDGLQHYRLQRDMEIAVVDAALKLDRARMLPAGPLREPVRRLKQLDAVVVNGDNAMLGAHTMRLRGQVFYNLANPQLTAKPEDFRRKTVKAMAGIGNPERFFNHLRSIGLTFAGVSFDDHHPFTAEDLAGLDCDVLIMTEKDAVKCKPYAQPHHWVLPVEAEVSGDLLAKVLNILKKGSPYHG